MREPITFRPDGPHSSDYTRQLTCAFTDVIRVLNYATMPGRDGIQYPSTAYVVLGGLRNGVDDLGQLFAQLGLFLVDLDRQHLLQVEYGPHKGHPAGAVRAIEASLASAATAAEQLVRALEAAHGDASRIGMVNADHDS